MPRLEAWKMPRVVRWVLTKKIKEKGFDSIDPNSPEESFLGVNNDNISVNIHYDATNKILDLYIRRQ